MLLNARVMRVRKAANRSVCQGHRLHKQVNDQKHGSRSRKGSIAFLGATVNLVLANGVCAAIIYIYICITLVVEWFKKKTIFSNQLSPLLIT